MLRETEIRYKERSVQAYQGKIVKSKENEKKTNKKCQRKRHIAYIGPMTSKIYWGIIKEEKSNLKLNTK